MPSETVATTDSATGERTDDTGAEGSPTGDDDATDGAPASDDSVQVGLSPRVRAVVAGLVVLGTALQAGTTAVIGVGIAIAGLAAAAVIRPAIRDHWAYNAAVGGCVVAFGLASALTVAGPARVAGAVIALLGALMVGNHLGVVPWSDHPRQI